MALRSRRPLSLGLAKPMCRSRGKMYTGRFDALQWRVESGLRAMSPLIPAASRREQCSPTEVVRRFSHRPLTLWRATRSAALSSAAATVTVGNARQARRLTFAQSPARPHVARRLGSTARPWSARDRIDREDHRLIGQRGGVIENFRYRCRAKAIAQRPSPSSPHSRNGTLHRAQHTTTASGSEGSQG